MTAIRCLQAAGCGELTPLRCVRPSYRLLRPRCARTCIRQAPPTSRGRGLVHLPGHRLRTDYTDGDPDMEADFYILRHTTAPAVLTENFFMDSHPDYAFLLSPEGQSAIVDLHVNGITAYLL